MAQPPNKFCVAFVVEHSINYLIIYLFCCVHYISVCYLFVYYTLKLRWTLCLTCETTFIWALFNSASTRHRFLFYNGGKRPIYRDRKTKKWCWNVQKVGHKNVFLVTHVLNSVIHMVKCNILSRPLFSLKFDENHSF